MTPETMTLVLHRVPKGATIPKGTRYYVEDLGSPSSYRRVADGAADGTEWTLEPIPAPPELPTEPGSVILNVTTDDGEKHPVMFHGGNWDHHWADAGGGYYRPYEITSWTPATVIETAELERLRGIEQRAREYFDDWYNPTQYTGRYILGGDDEA